MKNTINKNKTEELISSEMIEKIDKLPNIVNTTKEKYKSTLRKWLQCFTNTKELIINKDNLTKFAEWLLQNNYHEVTANGMTITIIALARRLKLKVPSDIDIIQRCIMYNYAKHTDSSNTRGSDTLTKEMFEELIDTIKTKWNKRQLIKDRLVMFCLLAYHTCGRLNEILELERRHIKFMPDYTEINIPGTKTELSERKIKIINKEEPAFIESLKHWIDQHKIRGNDKIILTITYQGRSEIIYTVDGSKGITKTLMGQHFQEIYNVLFTINPKIWKNISLSTHSLRKTQATGTYKSTDNIQKLLDKGGWTPNSNSVKDYINIDLKKNNKEIVDENKKEKVYQVGNLFYKSNDKIIDILTKNNIKIVESEGLITLIEAN